MLVNPLTPEPHPSPINEQNRLNPRGHWVKVKHELNFVLWPVMLMFCTWAQWSPSILNCLVVFYFLDLNVTASEVIGNFGTVLNTGNSSQLHDNDIEYLTTVRTLNTGLNTNGRTVEISFTVVANGSYQPQSSLSLKVIY